MGRYKAQVWREKIEEVYGGKMEKWNDDEKDNDEDVMAEKLGRKSLYNTKSYISFIFSIFSFVVWKKCKCYLLKDGAFCISCFFIVQPVRVLTIAFYELHTETLSTLSRCHWHWAEEEKLQFQIWAKASAAVTLFTLNLAQICSFLLQINFCWPRWLSFLPTEKRRKKKCKPSFLILLF